MKRIMILVLGIVGFLMCDAGYEPQISQIAQINPYQKEYEQMLYPTVRITAGMSTGSGVIIETTDSTDKTQISIITAAHVVDNQNTVNIELYDSRVISASVVITDTVKDLALIRVETTDSHRLTQIYTAKLANKNYTPYLFSPVWAVGCSLGLPPRPSYGHLCAFAVNNWEISAPILPGNSGGGVFTTNTHELIGIAVWVRVYQGQLVTTMAGIVPINEIYQFLDKSVSCFSQLDESRDARDSGTVDRLTTRRSE